MSGGSPRPADRSSGRERILARIRASTERRSGVDHPGGFPGGGAPGTLEERFAGRLDAAGGTVVLLGSRGVASAWLRRFSREFGSVAAAPGVPGPLRPELPSSDAAEAELGVSLAVAAAADTGTVVLDSREGRGVQLLPPTHLVWLPRSALHASLEEAMDEVRRLGLPSALGLHTGPSKSADIGRVLVTGVHGPGRVVVGLIEDE